MLRLVLLCLVSFSAFAKDLTVVLLPGEGLSPQALQEFERETSRILMKSGVSLEFKTREQAAMKSFSDLILVKMTGRCEMNSFPPQLLDERGPLAWTSTSDGHVLPFSELPCDRLRESIKSVMQGSDYARGNELMGRAMGRVIAHEIYHILGNTRAHGKSGIAKEALSAAQLISDRLDFSDHDRALLRASRGD